MTRYCVVNSTGTNDSKITRAKIACDSCHAKKLKCGGRRPCSSCKKADRECHFNRADPNLIPLTSVLVDSSPASQSAAAATSTSIPNGVLDVNAQNQALLEQHPRGLRHSSLGNPSSADSADHSLSSQMPQPRFPEMQILSAEQPTTTPGVSNAALDLNVDALPWDMGFGMDSSSFYDDVIGTFPPTSRD